MAIRSSLSQVIVWNERSRRFEYIDTNEASRSRMEIKCVFFGPIQEGADTKTTTQTVGEHTTVIDLVEKLITEYASLDEQLLTDDGDIRDNIVVTINKRHIRHLDGEETELSNGDTVRITTSIQGG